MANVSSILTRPTAHNDRWAGLCPHFVEHFLPPVAAYSANLTQRESKDTSRISPTAGWSTSESDGAGASPAGIIMVAP